MFKDILTFLGLDYRDASLLKLYFVVLGISIPKIRFYTDILVLNIELLRFLNCTLLQKESPFKVQIDRTTLTGHY
jgi:hypothetical protein